MCRVISDELCNLSPDAYTRKLNLLTTRRGRTEALNDKVLRDVEREFKRLRTKLDTVCTLPDENFTCPCCALLCRMLVVDANFKCSHYQYASEYHQARKPVVAGQPGSAAAFFQPDDLVDKMIDVLTLADGGQPKKATCGPSQFDSMRGKTHATCVPMDIDAINVACCSHGCFRTAFNFKGGEKGVYSEAILQLAKYNVGILCGDSMCRLRGLLSRFEADRCKIEPALREELGLAFLHACPTCAVNAMHVLAVRARARPPCTRARSHRRPAPALPAHAYP